MDSVEMGKERAGGGSEERAGGVPAVEELLDTTAVDDAPDVGTDILDSHGGSTAPGVEAAAAALGVRRQTARGDVWRRFRRNKLAVLGLVMIVSLVVVALTCQWISPYDPYHQDLTNTISPPSASHWFGTDQNGRDQFSRVLFGTRIALMVGLSSIGLSVFVGVLLGSLAGYFGKWVDALVMRIADIFFAFPLLLGAILIVTVVGVGVLPVILALAIFSWATAARLLRASILSVRETEYVEAARALGAGGWRIVTRHILPNSYVPVLIYATFNVGVAVVAESSLSFVGAGVKPDVPEWGNMVAAGQTLFTSQPWLSLLPACAVVYTTLAFVFTGDGLRDALDPKLK